MPESDKNKESDKTGNSAVAEDCIKTNTELYWHYLKETSHWTLSQRDIPRMFGYIRIYFNDIKNPNSMAIPCVTFS